MALNCTPLIHQTMRGAGTACMPPTSNAGEHFSVDGTLIQAWAGHTLSDNRHGLIANALVTTANGHAEREAAKVMTTVAHRV